MKKSLLFLSLIASFSMTAQWTEQATGFTEPSRGLSEIKIVDANTVWALAYDGLPIDADHPETLNIQEMTMTTDGGANWNAKVIELGNPELQINNISPVSATTAWLSALIADPGTDCVIFKTEDGGDFWTEQVTGGFTTLGESFINGVHFFNENDGVAYGDPVGTRFEIYTTNNGGTTWTQVPAANIPVKLANEYGYNNSPIVVGNTIWFTTSRGRLFRSSDKGLTWLAFQAPLSDFGGYTSATSTGSVYFTDVNNGFLLKNVRSGSAPNYTYARTYATTVNGGQTWIPPSGTLPTFTGERFLLNYIPGTTTMVATALGTPYGTAISTNNGVTWEEVEADDQRGTTAFLNATTAWCAGFNVDDIQGGIFKLTSPLATPSVTASKFNVYPNPASSVVTISTANVDAYKLSVTDLSGKKVMTKSLNGIENTVDVSSLPTGAYFFEFASDNKREVVKILKN